MTASDHSTAEPAPRRRAGRATGRDLLAVVLGLAVLAAAALVFTDDARWLRLGVVAALWAALVGAFAAARYRREVAGHTDRSEELRRVYELELEREVAARREYELEVEATTRRRIEGEARTEVRDELDGLRSELRTLRQNLEALLGGEVLVERVALRAESTRLRSLSDQSRAARSAERALPRGQGADAEVVSARIERPDAPAGPARSSWPSMATGDNADSTDILPRYRPRQERLAPEPSARPQPVSPKPERPDPARHEPVRAPAARHQPARTEPAPTTPVRQEPVHSASWRAAEPLGVEPLWAAELDRPPRYEPAEPSPARHAHRNAETEPPAARSWERSDAWPQAEPSPVTSDLGHHGNGGRRRHSSESEPPTTAGGRRRAAEGTGSHSSGRSVDDLLAALNDEAGAPRRHRRREH